MLTEAIAGDWGLGIGYWVLGIGYWGLENISPHTSHTLPDEVSAYLSDIPSLAVAIKSKK
jgi:hypothetical protein